MYGGGFTAHGMKGAGGDVNLPRLQQLSVCITTARYLQMMELSDTEVHWQIHLFASHNPSRHPASYTHFYRSIPK